MDDAGSVRLRHENDLLALPGVVGVGVGRNAAGTEVIDVYVQRAVPRRELASEEMIPDALEGVPVRVVPIGEVTAQDL